MVYGQARKSLWIETFGVRKHESRKRGQARKSLWIETPKIKTFWIIQEVRLVRACGSKLDWGERSE